jgi:GAF domain-containing protein
MADQLAVAIDNARLYSESQLALHAERRAFAAQSRLSWQDWLNTQPGLSLLGDDLGVSRANHIWNPEMAQAYRGRKTYHTGEKLAVPIHVRGYVIGVFYVERAAPEMGEGEKWTTAEITFLENVADQLGVALDSARLFGETQQQADRERIVGEITSRLRSTMDIETILKAATKDIRDALELSEVEVRIGTPDENGQ